MYIKESMQQQKMLITVHAFLILECFSRATLNSTEKPYAKNNIQIRSIRRLISKYETAPGWN